MLVDSHCHLDFPDFEEDRDALVARARAAGVGLMVTISTKFSQADKIIALSEQYEDVLCSVGTHPHEAGAETTVSGDIIAAKATHAKVIGIGETGLDYFYEHSEKEKQKQSFIAHIEASRLTQLPLIVHARDADTDTAQILENEMAIGTYPGLIHCFTAGPELARRALDMGFYISISGIATFKNAQNLRDVIKTIPLDRLLVETDAPYLAPMPHRGKRNEPSFVSHTAARLAELFDISAEDFAAQTTQNFFRLFTKANKPV
ncbi:TatD family hydrolase [Alphaproteobacteria bacterium]|nr:TatD family hydrolase [Alphaproteobacteria bacterium]